MTTQTISCWETFVRIKCAQMKLFSCEAVKLENGFLGCDSIGTTVVTIYPIKLLGYWWKIFQSPLKEPVNTIFKHLVIISLRLTDDGATTPKVVSD